MGSIILYKAIQLEKDNSTRKTVESQWAFCFNVKDSSSTSKGDIGSFEVWSTETDAKERAKEWQEHRESGAPEPADPTGEAEFVCHLIDIQRSSLHHIIKNYKDIIQDKTTDPLVGQHVSMVVPVTLLDGTIINAAVKLQVAQGTDANDYKMHGVHDGNMVDFEMPKSAVRKVAARKAAGGVPTAPPPVTNYPIDCAGIIQPALLQLLKSMPESQVLADDQVDGFELLELMSKVFPSTISITLTKPGAIADIGPLDELMDQVMELGKTLQKEAAAISAKVWSTGPAELGAQIAAFMVASPGASGMAQVAALYKKVADSANWDAFINDSYMLTVEQSFQGFAKAKSNHAKEAFLEAFLDKNKGLLMGELAISSFKDAAATESVLSNWLMQIARAAALKEKRELAADTSQLTGAGVPLGMPPPPPPPEDFLQRSVLLLSTDKKDGNLSEREEAELTQLREDAEKVFNDRKLMLVLEGLMALKETMNFESLEKELQNIESATPAGRCRCSQ